MKDRVILWMSLMSYLCTHIICSELVQRILMLRGHEEKADSLPYFEYTMHLTSGIVMKKKRIFYPNINEKQQGNFPRFWSSE